MKRFTFILTLSAIFFTSFAGADSGITSSAAFNRLSSQAATTEGASIVIQLKHNRTASKNLAHGHNPTAQADAAMNAAAHAIQNGFLRSPSIKSMVGKDIKNVSKFDFIPFMAMKVNSKGLKALAKNPNVVSIEEDIVVRPALWQSAPAVKQTPYPWSYPSYSGNGQIVAIVDTGVDKFHPMFWNKVISEACFLSGPGPQCPNGGPVCIGAGCAPDEYYHGTHVAGVAAGHYIPSQNLGGIAHKADIFAIKVLNTYAFGRFSDITKALLHVYASRNSFGAKKIAGVNVSIAGVGTVVEYFGYCDAQFPSMLSAINQLRSVRIPTMIAAGNNFWSNGTTAPGCISRAITVGSNTLFTGPSNFTNDDDFVDIYAPGSPIVSAYKLNGYKTSSGTSQATPHVTGAMTLLKQVQPTASVHALLAALQSTGKLLWSYKSNLWLERISILSARASLGTTPNPFGLNFNGPSHLNYVNKIGSWVVQYGSAISAGTVKKNNTLFFKQRSWGNQAVNARVVRIGQPGAANWIAVRAGGTSHCGNATVFGQCRPWSGYFFQYRGNGQYSVWKRVNGAWTVLRHWTLHGAVNPGTAWNLLQVHAIDNQLKFFINGALVWAGTDAELRYGKTGVGFFRDDATISQFRVDYISTIPLTTPVHYYGIP